MSKFYFLHPSNIHQYGGLTDEVAVAVDALGEENVGYVLPPAVSDSVEPKIVLPRYRAIPFGKELEAQVELLGHSLINTYREHRNIADLSNWWPILHEVNLTPRRYVVDDVPYLPEGEWFVKGETNSIKNRWFDCCYASTTSDLPRVIRNNQLDVYVGSQTIYIQPFQTYRKLGEAVDGRPVFNERRVFVYKGDVLSHADYWSSFPEYHQPPLIEGAFEAALHEAVELTKHLASFYVVDLAELDNGQWSVVELNDGVMSGLSDNSPESVFGTLMRK